MNEMGPMGKPHDHPEALPAGGAAQTALATLRDASGVAFLVQSHEPLLKVIEHFDRSPQQFGVLVMEGDRFVHMMSREWMDAQLARPNARELFLKRPIASLLRFSPLRTLELPDSTTIPQAIERALSREPKEQYQPIAVSAADGSRWLLSINALLIQQCRILSATLDELETQRRATLAAEADREHLQQRLVAASRDAGRAEVATGILHDVGNVLNSVNVSVSVLNKTLQQSKLPNLGRSLQLIDEHQADLAAFFATDERGQRLPGYLAKLAEALSKEQASMNEELASLGRSIEHIRHVVKMQQSYAKGSTLRETVQPAEIVESALQMNLVSFERHNVAVTREYGDLAPVPLDKHKTLQILVNLVSNAKDAIKVNAPGQRRILVRIERISDHRLQFVVSDNGSGIAPENLTRIFTHGFTTRKEGHGFGLHGSANAAREMGGSLFVASDGPGKGATFILEIPIGADACRNNPGATNIDNPKAKVAA
jgi:signal transduction histidine kinase